MVFRLETSVSYSGQWRSSWTFTCYIHFRWVPWFRWIYLNGVNLPVHSSTTSLRNSAIIQSAVFQSHLSRCDDLLFRHNDMFNIGFAVMSCSDITFAFIASDQDLFRYLGCTSSWKRTKPQAVINGNKIKYRMQWKWFTTGCSRNKNHPLWASFLFLFYVLLCKLNSMSTRNFVFYELKLQSVSHWRVSRELFTKNGEVFDIWPNWVDVLSMFPGSWRNRCQLM